MKKKKSKKIYIIIFIFLIVVLILSYMLNSGNLVKVLDKNVLEAFVGEPFREDNTINNLYFGINQEGKYAKSTTDGINNAINYAKQKNISYLKLEKGIYCVDGSVKDLTLNNTKKGIQLQSNMELDLNGSIIRQETNNKERYSIFSIYDVENISIKNGIIIGDKDTHNYTEIKGTHEWGYGVDVKGSVNINIENLQISKMTGDGICISDLKEKDNENKVIMPSESVVINNCNIQDCRRQGISAISVKGLTISNNEIHKIKGTNPQAAIDLETNDDGTQIVDNVKIYGNKLYDLGVSTAILNYSRIYNVEIFDNEINGKIVVYQNNDQIYIHNNEIKNGSIIAKIDDGQYNKGVKIQNLIIENNILINTSISNSRVNKLRIMNNEIKNGNIEIKSCNATVQNNKITTDTKLNFAYKYGILEADNNSYHYSIKNNIAEGEFTEIEIKENNTNIIYE